MKRSCLSFLLALLVSGAAYASDSNPDNKRFKSNYNNEEGFAAPGSTVRLLEEDDLEKASVFRFPEFDETLKPWFEQKKKLNDEQGLQLSLAYTMTYQKASASLTDEDQGATGILRASGKWEALNRGQKNKGSLVFSIDNRHKLGDVAAADLANEIGYIGSTAVLFSDVGTVLVDFNWQQFANDGNTGILVGRYDPSDYLNILGYVNPWTTFQNLNTLLDSSVAYPDAGLGAGFGHWFNDHWYTVAGFNDANGKLDEVNAYQDGAEFFKFAELGWSPGRDQRYLTNIHVSFWDVDEREQDGLDAAYGITVAANWTQNETWMIFGKLGWSDVDAPNDPQIYEESYTIGGLYNFSDSSDLAGIAINHGELAAEGLGTQTTGELFYRIQFAQNLAITPSLQVLKDPALNDEKETITILGLRLRLTL